MTLVDTRGNGERPTVKARVATSEGVFKGVRLVYVVDGWTIAKGTRPRKKGSYVSPGVDIITCRGERGYIPVTI